MLLISIFCLRLISNFYLYNDTKLFTLTHLRIDSLLAGVLLSYLYCFKFDKLQEFYRNFHRPLLVFSFLCLIWTPFINPLPSFFVKTIGFSLLHLSFSILSPVVIHVFSNQCSSPQVRILWTASSGRSPGAT